MQRCAGNRHFLPPGTWWGASPGPSAQQVGSVWPTPLQPRGGGVVWGEQPLRPLLGPQLSPRAIPLPGLRHG